MLVVFILVAVKLEHFLGGLMYLACSDVFSQHVQVKSFSPIEAAGPSGDDDSCFSQTDLRANKASNIYNGF